MVTVSEAVLERVERGAEWLDANYPGWEGRIDLDSLAMQHCERCVIGQVFGDYYEVALRQNWWESDAQALGFYLVSLGRESGMTYRTLGEAWKSLILARRAAAKAALQGIADAVTQEREAGVLV